MVVRLETLNQVTDEKWLRLQLGYVFKRILGHVILNIKIRVIVAILLDLDLFRLLLRLFLHRDLNFTDICWWVRFAKVFEYRGGINLL